MSVNFNFKNWKVQWLFFSFTGGTNGIVRVYLRRSWTVSVTQHAYLQKPRMGPCPLALRGEMLPTKILKKERKKKGSNNLTGLKT